MQSSRAVDVGVGLFILLGLVSSMFLLVQSLGLSSTLADSGYELHARFDHVGDLKVRAPVALAGVTIGRVANIAIDMRELRAQVTMQIDRRYDSLPGDSFASIASSGLLGGKYIELEPGGSDELLKDGDEVELTQSSISLENLIGKYMISGTGKPASD